MLILCTLLAAFVTAEAPNLSGEWSLTMNPDFKDNPNVVSRCVFRQSGAKLTVRCGTGSELAGSVKGRIVTWGFSPENGEKYPAATMTGTVNEAGNRIKGTWHLSIIGGDKRGEFSAVKQAKRSRRGHSLRNLSSAAGPRVGEEIAAVESRLTMIVTLWLPKSTDAFATPFPVE